jgi:hypothetical protein
MAKQFKNVAELITGLSEDENFKIDAVKHISERGFGKFLTSLRCEQKLTQKEMADKFGCTQRHISKMESASNDKLLFKDFVRYINVLGFNVKVSFRDSNLEEEACW